MVEIVQLTRVIYLLAYFVLVAQRKISKVFHKEHLVKDFGFLNNQELVPLTINHLNTSVGMSHNPDKFVEPQSSPPGCAVIYLYCGSPLTPALSNGPLCDDRNLLHLCCADGGLQPQVDRRGT